MAYVVGNPKTKKELKQQVQDYLDGVAVYPIEIFYPGIEGPTSGRLAVEGPHYPKPHTWYAQVEVKDGVIGGMRKLQRKLYLERIRLVCLLKLFII